MPATLNEAFALSRMIAWARNVSAIAIGIAGLPWRPPLCALQQMQRVLSGSTRCA
jgi:hypothetical protein